MSRRRLGIMCAGSLLAVAGAVQTPAATAGVSMRASGQAKSLQGSVKTHMKFPWTHFVTTAVRGLTDQDFRPPVGFHMKLADGSPSICELRISVASNSVAINKFHDNNAPHGYIVGLITNPDDCAIQDFKLAKKDTVAWFVEFTKPLDQSGQHDNMGHSGLIRLRGGLFGKDAWFPGGRDWAVGYCNHAPRVGATDEVMVLPYDSVCTAPSHFDHDGKRLSDAVDKAAADQRAAMSTRVPLTPTSARLLTYIVDGEDISLWFACGGDCCYTSAQR